MTQVQLSAGFADPVDDSQSVFRTLMQAMARPGAIGRIPVRVDAPAPLGPGIAALALALCDGDTPVWLDARLATGAVSDFIRFHTGAPVVADPGEAAFAFVVDPVGMPALDSFALGTLDYPDRSTTLVVAADSLETDRGWRLAGPGIDGEARLGVTPMKPDFLDRRGALAPLFPRGLDMVFVAGDRVAALPRTTRLSPPLRPAD